MISIIISASNEILTVQHGGQAFLAIWSDQDAAQQAVSGYGEQWSLLAIRGVRPKVLTKVVAALAPVRGCVINPNLYTKQIEILAMDD